MGQDITPFDVQFFSSFDPSALFSAVSALRNAPFRHVPFYFILQS
jgi:hypothetical protein